MNFSTLSFPALLRRAGGALIVACGLLAPWAAHANGWVYCAMEGQVCNVNGPATVRFGADEDFEYRNVNGPIPCNNQVFGDPARGETKRCEYRLGHNALDNDRRPGGWTGGGGWAGRPNDDTGWQTCALEDEYCSFRGTREVRFGASGQYTVRTFSGGADCHVRTFGDPAPGLRKMCQIRDANGGWNNGGFNRPVAPVTPPDSGNWRFCADEDQYCRAPRGATIRFGSDGRYAYMNQVQGDVFCHVSTFGDPNKGERKRCEYSTNSGGSWGGQWGGNGGWNNGNNGWSGHGNDMGRNWVFCAEEDGECRVPRPTVVRFGANGRFNTLQVTGSVPCTPTAFGDPIKGERKRCEYAR